MDAFRQNLGSNSSTETKPRCRCGLVAVEHVSSKNNGRVYWKCGKNTSCHYFAWDDELDRSLPTGSWNADHQMQQGNAAYMADKTCFKCQQVRYHNQKS